MILFQIVLVSKFSMSNQFELENAIREATRMDTSISKTAWNKPRKALENTNTSLNISVGRWYYISW